MRPIRLEFAGLQSYREKQVIDFADLLGGGLFGIFGPTGAGKSTILDAITLALYGRVGRAERGTIGIMNQGENRLWVKFSFALGSEGEYRVERAYKREKETPSIRSEHARLVQRTAEGDLVLADKEREVNQQVTDLLGLQLDDFTRAVVLPQGQFAEFLKLSGRDRTQMLQRIFSLTQYGDRLAQRLKRRVEAVQHQLTAVQSEQIGLGDGSAEAVGQAETALQQAATQFADAERELTAVEGQVKAWERVWELQQELGQVAEVLSRWQGDAPAAEAWRAELAAARRAEQVRPHLEAEVQARRQVTEARERLARTEEALTQAREALERAVTTHEAARTKRVNEGPGLAKRQNDLQRALELEAGLDETRQRAVQLEASVAKGESLCADVARQLSEGEQRLDAMTAEEAELRVKLAGVEIDGDHRAQIAEARLLLDRLREAEKGRVELERRVAQRQEQLTRAEQEAERAGAERDRAQARLQELEREALLLEAEPPADEAELRAQEAWLGRAEEQIWLVASAFSQVERVQQEQAQRQAEAEVVTLQAEAAAAEEARLRFALGAARAQRDQAQSSLEEARRQGHAAALVQGLTPGAPCPVCGSTDHPHPASPADSPDIAAAQAALERAEVAVRQAEQGVEQGLKERAAADGRALTARSRAEEAREALAQAEGQLSAARARLPEAWRTLEPVQLTSAFSREAAEQEERKGRYQAWQAALTDLRKRREEQARLAATAAAAASDREATRRAAAEALTEGQTEHQAQGEAVVGRQAEFDQARGGYDAPGIEAEQKRIEAADREAGRLRQSLDRLRQGEQALEQALAELRRKEQQYTQLLHQRQVELAQAHQKRAETEGEWTSLTGGQPAGPQLAVAAEALRRLEKAEDQAAAAREEAERSRSTAEAEHAAARREAELAGQRSTEAAAALAHGLETAGFADGEAARTALRSPERQSDLEGQIRSYEQEGDRLQSRRTALLDQLAGRSLTEAEWQGWQERQGLARQAAVERREERARALQIRDDRLAKQRRWQELEEQRTALTTQVNHLDELRSLLRGNAFVDFLAEEQMSRVAAEASLRLGQLTRYRYALESEAGGGFLVRDDGNGGARRAVTTLSGGETFLASLSLALALSAQIQLRGHYPLEFFFLDEGFGTLDPELLDLVISTLERLHFENLHVGVISHVPELRSRLQRRVIVEAAEPGGRGSRIALERA